MWPPSRHVWPTPEDTARWIADDLVIVAERQGALLAWAKASPYADRHHYYDGVREATLYVDRGARRGGVGHALLGCSRRFRSG